MFNVTILERRGYALRKSTVLSIEMPSPYVEDALTEVLRNGARDMLARAVEAEVVAFLEAHREVRDERGRQMIARNGYLPEREIQTGIGSVAVRAPRVRDRRAIANDQKIQFTSKILPRYLGRTKSLEELIPWLYLKGVSTGDFSEALKALVGSEAPGLSASTVVRLKEGWQRDYEAWCRRDLSGKRYAYLLLRCMPSDGVRCMITGRGTSRKWSP